MAARLLFVASAAFVGWRSTQVAAFVDVAWILNNATRIALGDVPYRDFPLAQAPGTFVLQALLIKALGAHYWTQILYAAVCGGAATAIAYVITRRLLAAMPSPGMLAAVITLPLIPLGIYAIIPEPFYDPDACLVVLIALALLLAARDRPSAARFAIAGAAATLPLMFKQNIGGAFLASLLFALAVDATTSRQRGRELRWIGVGIVGALVVQATVLQVVVGLDAYVRGTIGFAIAGRGLALERLGEFAEPMVIAVVVVFAALAAATGRASARGQQLLAGGAALMLVVSLLPAVVLGSHLFFPPILVLALTLSFVRAVRAGASLEVLMPVVLAGTALGAIESAGLSASTYGIFPLLTLLIACVVRDLATLVPRPARLAPLAGALIAASLTGFGVVYTLDNVRLRFVDVNAPGPVARSSFPALSGLSASGPYIEELDEMLFWLRDNVPADESVVFVPGEDPAYFALQRRPPLPAVFFYFGDVATPQTPGELAAIADRVGVRWIVVKDRLQSAAAPVQLDITERLTRRATLVKTLGAYRIYRR